MVSVYSQTVTLMSFTLTLLHLLSDQGVHFFFH